MIYPFVFIINDEDELKLFINFIKRFTLKRHASWTHIYSNSAKPSLCSYPLPAVLGMQSKTYSWHSPLTDYGSVERLRKKFPDMPPIFDKDILYNPDNYPELFL